MTEPFHSAPDSDDEADNDLKESLAAGLGLLHLACRDDRPGAVQTLLDSGASTEARTHAGQTPLMFAKSAEVIKMLINAGARVDAQDWCGRTALMVTLANEALTASEALLEAGADVRVRDTTGYTAFMRIRGRHWNKPLWGRYPKVEQLLATKPPQRQRITDATIRKARRFLRADYVRSALAEGASLTTAISGDATTGATPFMDACENGPDAEIHAFLEAGADVDVRDGLGRTPLIRLCGQPGTGDRIRLLVELGASLEARTREGLTALAYASVLNQPAHVRLLLELGANASEGEEDGVSPLLLADAYTTHLIPRTLLQAGAGLNARDRYGRTPLMLAGRYGRLTTLRTFIEAGADLDAKDIFGNAALDHARIKRRRRHVKALLTAGARSGRDGTNARAGLASSGGLVEQPRPREELRALYGRFLDYSNDDRRFDGLLCELLHVDIPGGSAGEFIPLVMPNAYEAGWQAFLKRQGHMTAEGTEEKPVSRRDLEWRAGVDPSLRWLSSYMAHATFRSARTRVECNGRELAQHFYLEHLEQDLFCNNSWDTIKIVIPGVVSLSADILPFVEGALENDLHDAGLKEYLELYEWYELEDSGLGTDY